METLGMSITIDVIGIQFLANIVQNLTKKEDKSSIMISKSVKRNTQCGLGPPMELKQRGKKDIEKIIMVLHAMTTKISKFVSKTTDVT